MSNILIRCDASKEIGLGHLVRCLVLANKFRNLGHNVIFAMRDYKLGIQEVSSYNFKIEIAPKELNYYNWLCFCTNNYDINVFIGDVRDKLPLKSIITMKRQSILTIAIDEPSSYAKECDLSFYPPHANVNKLDYKGKVYQGLEYVILRDEFHEDYKKTKNDIPNILVMMGGTDSHHLTLDIVKQLLILRHNINISVVIKENHKHYNVVNKIENNVKVYSSIENMARFLNNVDFGIISFGVSAYELLANQIPAIHVCLDEDHQEASKWFTNNNYSNSIFKNQIKDIDLSLLGKVFIQKQRIAKSSIISRIFNLV